MNEAPSIVGLLEIRYNKEMIDPTKNPDSEPLRRDTSPRAAADPTPSKPGDKLTRGEVYLVAGVAAAAAAHAIIPEPAQPEQGSGDDAEAQVNEEQGEETTEHPSVGLDYGPVGEIVSKTKFAGETHTGEILNRYVDLYREVFRHDRGTVTYFDAQGNKLGEELLPDNWYKGMTDAQKQEWHNDHRQKADTSDKVLPTNFDDLGYPLMATAMIYGMDKRDDINSPFQLLDERLDNEELHDPSKRYFQGRKMSLRQAIIEIATAYDVPRAIAFGLGANESAFDRIAVSQRKVKDKKGKTKIITIAKGMFQFKEEGYIDAKNYAEQHPELSASIRQGPLLGFNQGFNGGVPEWKNRFVSTEMFCAYYRYLQEALGPSFDELEERLRALDPTLLVGTFDTIGTITAYNAGAGRIKACIKRFVERSDEELKQKIGEPPYGADVWMAVLAHSFGATLKKEDGTSKRTGVGDDVLTYAPKVLALGSLIMDEENHLSNFEREREGWKMPTDDESPEEGAVAENQGKSRRGLLRLLAGLTGIGAVAGGAFLGTQAVQERPISRRTALQGAAATAALALPFGKLFFSRAGTPESGDETPPPAPLDTPPRRYTHEKYDDNFLREAKDKLNATYEILKTQRKGKRKHKGIYDWTPTEQDRIHKYTTPKQIKELRGDYEAVFGEDWVRRFSESVGETLIKRKPLYEEGQRIQDAYIEDKLRTGDWVEMQADNPENPYFCEQVGKMGGTSNNPKSLYMHKEFVPLLGSLIELVNHQIDLFNQNPAAYGELDPEFPLIPHVNAVKISGALRSVQQTYDMLEQGHTGATWNLSNHWIGQAIDLASFRTPDSHMATFAEPLYARRTPPLGSPLFPANSKLPSRHKDGGRTREILSKMFGRALLALEEPLKEKGITLMPKWEGGQLNWHVGIKFS